MRILQMLSLLGLSLVVFTAQADSPYAGKKVLFINSYHKGYGWSDGITEGVESVLSPKPSKDAPEQKTDKNPGIELKILYMDTKRNDSEAFKLQAGLNAKAEIETFKPDVVIASDDNVSKYLIMPFYKDAALPFVFCGVNWDTSAYGFPYKNVTGMLEVDLEKQVIKNLRAYAKGDRVGFIGTDNESDRKNAENYTQVLGIKFAQVSLLSDFATWKKTFSRAQSELDMLIIGSHVSIHDWNEAEAKAFVETNIKIPVGTVDDWEMDYAVLGLTKVAEEQGIWAAQTALKIIAGSRPADIPIVTNEQGHLMLNLRLADKLGITFKPSLLKLAKIIR